MSESPKMRELSGKFAELARIQAIVDQGKADLLSQVSAVTERLSAQFTDDQFRNGVYVSEGEIHFRSRPILKLVFATGYQPSPKKTLARCEVRRLSVGREDDPVVAVLHLVRVNDHGEWEHVPMQAFEAQTRLTVEHLLGLLDTYVSAELKRYAAGAP